MTLQSNLERIDAITAELKPPATAVPRMAQQFIKLLEAVPELKTDEEKLDALRAIAVTSISVLTMAGANTAEVMGQAADTMLESGEAALAVRRAAVTEAANDDRSL